MAFAGRFRELVKKYGKVAFGVHMSVSAASIAGLYVAIKNNVDVESMIEKIPGLSKEDSNTVLPSETVGISGASAEESHSFPPSETITEKSKLEEEPASLKKKNRTAEMAASSGGAIALAILCNKALFPVRVPITIALTPPIARFLARRKIIKSQL